MSEMSSMLTGEGGYSQVNSLTFVDGVGLDYGGDTQGIPDYVYDDFTLPSQTQSSQSQPSQLTQGIQPGQGITSVYCCVSETIYKLWLELFISELQVNGLCDRRQVSL